MPANNNQTTTGCPAYTIDPRIASGYVLFLDADNPCSFTPSATSTTNQTGVPASGSKVGTWFDSSQNENHFSQSNLALQPEYISSGGLLNNKPYLRGVFNDTANTGVGPVLAERGTSLSDVINGSHTIIMLVATNDSPYPEGLYFGNEYAFGKEALVDFYNRFMRLDTYQNSAPLFLRNSHFLAYRYDPSKSYAEGKELFNQDRAMFELWDNGYPGEPPFYANTRHDVSTLPMLLGALADGTKSAKSQWYKVLVYPRVLNSAEIALIATVWNETHLAGINAEVTDGSEPPKLPDPFPVDDDFPAPDPTLILSHLQDRFSARVMSRDGLEYYSLPSGAIESAEWSKDQKGGYGSFTMTAAASDVGDGLDVFDIPAFAQTEFFVDGVCDYRGFITKPSHAFDTMSKYNFSGFGLFTLAGEVTIPVPRVYREPMDVATIFADLASLTLKDKYEGLQITSLPVGVTRDTANYRRKSFKEAADALMEQASGAASWGFYHSEADMRSLAVQTSPASLAAFNRPNTLVFKPSGSRTQPDHFIMVPASNVEAPNSDPDFMRIYNTILLTGGSRSNPNLLYNADWSRPVKASGSSANLLQNGDFEEGGAHWGGTGQPKPSGGEEGNAFSGSNFFELDNPSESVSQTNTITGQVTPGDNYQFAFRYRLEKQDAPNQVEAYVAWNMQGGGTVIAYHETFTNASASWSIKEQPIVAPATGTVQSVTVIITVHDGAGNHHGTLVDAVEVYSLTARRQDGWEAYDLNNAHLRIQNWVYGDVPSFADGYALYLEGYAEDTDNQDITVQMRNGARYNLNEGEDIRAIVHLKNPNLAASSPKMKLVLLAYKADGSYSGKSELVVPVGALNSDSAAAAVGGVPVGNGWYRFSKVRAGNFEEVAGTLHINQRSEGAVLVACPSVRNKDEDTWVPDGDLFMKVRSDDSHLDYLSLGVTPERAQLLHDAVVLYPQRDKQLTVASITTEADGYAYIARWINQNATPENAPTLTISEPYAEGATAPRFMPGETVFLGGAFGARLHTRVFTIARVRTKIAENRLTVSLELDREYKDEAGQFIELIDRRMQRQNYSGAQSVGAGAANPATGSGGGSWASSGATFINTLKASSSDPTLHDDYRPANGPHVLDSERTDWNATRSEVITGRSTYASLDARFVAMAGSIPAPTYISNLKASSSDATLHDNYRPANGPHITAAERTDWVNRSSEVATARSTSFSSLGARLDNMTSNIASIPITRLGIDPLGTFQTGNIVLKAGSGMAITKPDAYTFQFTATGSIPGANAVDVQHKAGATIDYNQSGGEGFIVQTNGQSSLNLTFKKNGVHFYNVINVVNMQSTQLLVSAADSDVGSYTTGNGLNVMNGYTACRYIKFGPNSGGSYIVYIDCNLISNRTQPTTDTSQNMVAQMMGV